MVIDEGSFGPRQVRGVRDGGVGKKIIVYGLFKRGGKVYTQVVPNVMRETVRQIVQAKGEPDSTIYSDCWKSHNGLVDWGYKRHYRVNHGQKECEFRYNMLYGDMYHELLKLLRKMPGLSYSSLDPEQYFSA